MLKQLSSKDKSDLMYVQALCRNGSSTTLDMSDPVQKSFYEKQLELANISKERRPNFFKNLDALTKTHEMYKEQKSIMKHLLGDANAVPDNSVNAVTQLSTADGQNFVAGAVSSVAKGTQMTLVTIGLFDADFNSIGAVGKTEEFNNGICTVATATGSFSTPMPAEGREITAVATYNYTTVNGMTAKNAMVTTVKFPKELHIDAPVISNANKTDPTHKKIKLCMNRADSDCDYNYTSGPTGSQTVVLPFKGYINYFDTVDQITFDRQGNPLNASCTFSVAATGNGGSAVTPPTNYNFFTDQKTSISGSTISWDVPWLRFDDTQAYGPIGSAGQDLYFIFQLTVPVKGQNVAAFITNAPPEKTPGSNLMNTLMLPIFTAINGCLGRGSIVKMADGSSKAVEEIVVGDQVLNGNGKALTVTDTVIGNEITMVEITFNKNKTLVLTDNHPVVTPTGILLAKEIFAGHKIVTDEGVVVVDKIEEILYIDKVFNLVLTDHSKTPVFSEDNTTHYANGVLVGDGNIQRIYMDKYRKNHNNILNTLPSEWHNDFMNYLEEQKSNNLVGVE